MEAGNGLGLTEVIVGVTGTGACTLKGYWFDDWLPSSTFTYQAAAVTPKVGLTTNCVELREAIGMFG